MAGALLVVVMTGEWLPQVPNMPGLHVTSLTPDETKRYLEDNAPALAPLFGEVHALTGGEYRWLDAFRDAHARGGDTDLERIAREVRTSSYADRLVAGLQLAERVALHCLVRLPVPADRELATRYLLPAAGTPGLPAGFEPAESVERLVRFGAVGVVPGTEGRLIWVPHVKRDAVASLEVPELASPFHVARRFITTLGDSPERAVRTLYAADGGPAILRAAQACFLDVARSRAAPRGSGPQETDPVWKIAANIARFADGDARVTQDLLELYRSLAHDDAPVRVRVEALRRGALLAGALGLADIANDYVGKLDGAETSNFGRAEFLLTRARVAKDLRQWHAVADVLADVRDALDALAGEPAGADPARLGIELRQLRIDTRLFLQGATVAEVDEDVVAIGRLNPTDAQRANLLATLAERLQDAREGERVDWGRVGKIALDAYVAASRSPDPRARSFAAYRYARYLECMPNPEHAEAGRCYADAESAARDAGDPRREALAGLRRLQVEWGHLRTADARAADADAVRLLHLLPDPLQGDALTLRTAQRLHLLRFKLAEADPRLGPSLDSLEAACRVGARLPPGSVKDDERLGRSLHRLLAALHAAASLRDAHLLVREMEDPLRDRLHVRSEPLNPWDVEAELANRYNTAGARRSG